MGTYGGFCAKPQMGLGNWCPECKLNLWSFLASDLSPWMEDVYKPMEPRHKTLIELRCKMEKRVMIKKTIDKKGQVRVQLGYKAVCPQDSRPWASLSHPLWLHLDFEASGRAGGTWQLRQPTRAILGDVWHLCMHQS